MKEAEVEQTRIRHLEVQQQSSRNRIERLEADNSRLREQNSNGDTNTIADAQIQALEQQKKALEELEKITQEQEEKQRLLAEKRKKNEEKRRQRELKKEFDKYFKESEQLTLPI